MNPKNPFLIEGYHSPKYFCDRKRETAALVSALENDRNVTLIAPRRMGKSGLIKNVFYELQQSDEFKCAYIDLFGTQNLTEFVRAFASGVFSAYESTLEKMTAAASKFLMGFRPTLAIDAFGTRKYSFDIAPSFAEVSLTGVFDYLESRKFSTVVALDEFQQIAEYPEKGTEALLRSRIQFLAGNRFIFSGSRQHMMAEMFVSAKRPFYHSTQLMHIGEIDKNEYYAFAEGHFRSAGMALPQEVFDAVYTRFGGITWYVQAVMNRLYEMRSQTLGQEDALSAIEWLVAAGAYEFQGILQNCSDGAVRLLKAIANEGVVKEPNAGEFVSKYAFKSASSVNAALKSLRDADLVDRTDAGYIVYDRLFALWLTRLG